MREKGFQLLPLEYSTDARWRLIYPEVLLLWLMPQLHQDKSNVVFQHDGVPPHTHSEVTTFLNRGLPERCIGRGGGVHSPVSEISRSPDLTPLDFFLWGFVKDDV
jgi:hypothetical protein